MKASVGDQNVSPTGKKGKQERVLIFKSCNGKT
jgi:hypothetical protein